MTDGHRRLWLKFIGGCDGQKKRLAFMKEWWHSAFAMLGRLLHDAEGASYHSRMEEKMKTLMKGLIVFAALLLAASAAQAAIDPAKVQKLLADDGDTGDSFGYSVAVDGDIAVIGAAGDDDKGSSSGAAYIFIRAADGT